MTTHAKTPPGAPRHDDSPTPEPLVPGLEVPARQGTAFDDLMSTVEFRVAPQAHITVDTDVCRACPTRVCVHACPARLFVPTADGGMVFNHEQCFECGTCYLVCDADGAINWSYPEGGHGVVFRKG